MVYRCVDGYHHRMDGQRAKQIRIDVILSESKRNQQSHNIVVFDCKLTFIATPRTRGHDFRFALYLWYERPAFKIGLSIRPPPATIPELKDLLNSLKSTRSSDSFILGHYQYTFSKSL